MYNLGEKNKVLCLYFGLSTTITVPKFSMRCENICVMYVCPKAICQETHLHAEICKHKHFLLNYYRQDNLKINLNCFKTSYCQHQMLNEFEGFV